MFLPAQCFESKSLVECVRSDEFVATSSSGSIEPRIRVLPYGGKDCSIEKRTGSRQDDRVPALLGSQLFGPEFPITESSPIMMEDKNQWDYSIKNGEPFIFFRCFLLPCSYDVLSSCYVFLREIVPTTENVTYEKYQCTFVPRHESLIMDRCDD